MSVNKNPLWNYGSIISPDKLNEIEIALNAVSAGCIDKEIVFNSDGSIIEYFGENVFDGAEIRNNKETIFNDSENQIIENYIFYFKSGENNEVDYTKYTITKTITFQESGSIKEALGKLVKEEKKYVGDN